MSTHEVPLTPASRPVRGTGLLPREHGAWAFLFAPVVAALWATHASPRALLVAAVATCGFLLHEPFVVLIGLRGQRLRDAHGLRARLWIFALGTLGAACVAVLLATLPLAETALLAIPVAASLAVFVLALKGSERTTAGELAVTAALPSWALPMAPGPEGVRIAVVFALGFGCAALAARDITHRAVRDNAGPTAAVAAMLVLVPGWVLALGKHVRVSTLLALVPLCAASAALSALRPHPRFIRWVGVLLLACALISVAVLAST